jgi:hypothetical protein
MHTHDGLRRDGTINPEKLLSLDRKIGEPKLRITVPSLDPPTQLFDALPAFSRLIYPFCVNNEASPSADMRRMKRRSAPLHDGKWSPPGKINRGAH